MLGWSPGGVLYVAYNVDQIAPYRRNLEKLWGISRGRAIARARTEFQWWPKEVQP